MTRAIKRGGRQGIRGTSKARRALRQAAKQAVLEQLEGRVLMSSTLTVVNTNDSGTGSLRYAIQQANNAPGSTIEFNIPQQNPGSPVPRVIQLASALDSLTAPVTMDATTEPGYAPGELMVEVRGPSNGSAGIGLDVAATSTIKGLAINGFSTIGVQIEAGADGTLLQNDFIGTDATGTIAMPNGGGVWINANNVQVIDDLVSANTGDGIAFQTVTGGTVASDRIGTDVTGELPLGNSGAGISLNGTTDVTIGGAGTLMNVISDNSGAGIYLTGYPGGTSNINILDNYIGLDASGTRAITTVVDPFDASNMIPFGNAGAGVEIDSTSSNTLVSGNVIAGSGGNGIDVSDYIAETNTISDNFIGTNAAGTAAVPNQGDGIVLNSGGTIVSGNLISGNTGFGMMLSDYATVQNNMIGTDVSGGNLLPNQGDGIQVFDGSATAQPTLISGNTVAFNGKAGVDVFSGTNVTISQNSIFSNTTIGIDLGNDGITANDSQGHTSGPNLYQDFPVLTSITRDASQATIAGMVFGPASSTITVEFFTNVSSDGDEEGHVFLGSATVSTDASGNGSFSVSFANSNPALAASQTLLSATATDAAGNTSEFCASQPLPAAPSTGPTIAPTSTTIGSSTNPSQYGQPVTFTASVTASGAPVTSGLVDFYDGSNWLGQGSLNAAGLATFTTDSSNALSIGSHGIIASFEATASLSASTSAALPQGVTQDAAAVSIASSANPSVYGQVVTISANVSAAGYFISAPTGMVTLYDGLSQVGAPVAIDTNGNASWTLDALSTGTHSLTVQYGGDSNFMIASSAPLPQDVNQAATTVSVISSANPSTYGQSVTFTANVSALAPGVATPSGTVTFLDNGMAIGSGTLTDGVATFATVELSVGGHPITATFVGDTNCASSASSPVAQTVNQAASGATLSSDINPSVFGQAVTFTATVTGASGTPSGAVSLYDGSTDLADGMLDANGKWTWSTTGLPVGDHSLTLVYGGDANYVGVTSPTYVQTVEKAGTATTITSLLAPTVYGQSVTFTANVSVTGNGSGTPGGTVEFFDGTTLIGSGTLDVSGDASYTTSTLSPGNHTITAQYIGNTGYLPSVSAPVTQSVGLDASETVLSSSADPSVYGQSIMLVATVIDQSLSSYTPTGTLSFYDGSTFLGQAALDASGKATLPVSGLAVGSHPMTASYNGDSYVGAGTSAPMTQTVTRAASIASLASSVNPSVFGQNVQLTATVSSSAGMPTGVVYFYDGSTQLGQGTLDASGHATFSTSALSVGSHSLSVSYGGDGTFLSSSSASIAQAVNQAPTQTAITASASSLMVGQPVTFTANVSVLLPGMATASGVVTFLDNGVAIGTASVSNGVATFSTASLSAGGHNISASYGGNTNCAPSASPATSVTVNAAAVIGGRVFRDLTGDGYSSDDTGMAGVSVRLYLDTNSNGAVDSADKLLATATSAANGSYSFGGLMPGQYLVEEVTPSGYVRTLPTVAANYTIAAMYGTVAMNNNFDNFQLCNCKTDLTSYSFHDGCHSITDLRGKTHEGDIVSATFTLKPGDTDQFYLVVYSAPDSTFVAAHAYEQQVLQAVGGTFTGGTHTLTVHLPYSNYQVDFICGSVIYNFGPANSNIFYTPQDRLISADNE